MNDNKNKERIEFNIHSQRFEIEKTYKIVHHHEVHTLSLSINNVNVYFNEWNIEL